MHDAFAAARLLLAACLQKEPTRGLRRNVSFIMANAAP
jgi:hypothetical protein